MFDIKYPRTNGDVINLDWLLSAVKTLEEAVATLEEEWSKIKVLTKEEIQSMIDESIATYDTAIQAVIESAKEASINQSKSYTDAQNEIIRALITITAEETLNASKEYSVLLYNQMKDYVDQQLVTYNYMYSPITGMYEDVRDVVTEIVNEFHRVNALTAQEYDALDLTADEYDFNGKTLLI